MSIHVPKTAPRHFSTALRLGVFLAAALLATLFSTNWSTTGIAVGGSRWRAGQEKAPQPAVEPLEQGKPIDRPISGGEKHYYQLALREGEYAKVTIEQHAIDFTVRCYAPDGKVMSESDQETTLNGDERAEVVASVAGAYKIEIDAKYKVFPAGSYVIRIDELRAATDNDRSLQEARELYRQAFYDIPKGKYDEAQKALERVLEIRQKILGPDHRDIAHALTSLGNIAYYKGDLPNSERYFRASIDMLKKTVGPEHAYLATTMNNLASLYSVKGDLPAAELIHKEALKIREQVLWPEHPDIAQSLNNLANIYNTKGDVESAEPLYQRAIEINEKVLGADHVNLAFPLNNLGQCYMQREEFDKAEAMLQRALAIREKQLGKDHPGVAMVVYNLGETYVGKGDYEKAERLHQRALKIRETALGLDHPESARSLNSLGTLYLAQNRFDLSEEFYNRALEIRERVLGPAHPDTLKTLNGLAKLYTAKGDFPRAIQFQARAIEGTEKDIDLNLAIGSERQKETYLANLPEELDRAISLNVSFAPQDQTAADLAATTVLRRKGRVLDAMSDSFASLRSRADMQGQSLIAKFNEVTAQLARLVLNGPRGENAAEHQKKIKALEADREALESEISRSVGFYERPAHIGLNSVKAEIPADAALLEFATFLLAPKDQKEASSGSPHYAVYILRRSGQVQWKDLGPAQQIDDSVAALRKALHDPRRADVKTIARSVDEKVMRPVRAMIGDATRLLVSPDGSLNLIPFEALCDERGKYLLERYTISYLTSGRDLLRLRVPRPSKQEPVVLADPWFGEPSVSHRPAGKPRVKNASFNKRRQNVTTGEDLSSVYFGRLTGTAQEAGSIKALFPQATLLTGKQATESALKSVNAPELLHIATHGFFLQDPAAKQKGEISGLSGTRAINALVRVDNPLLRSGLALAGANTTTGGTDDGVLTALEASGLNLWGTKLVTLSACDTGIGEVKNGEGVYGLRRAFTLAGAETLVMSLWAVSDVVTRELMTAYYERLKAGEGRGEALRHVKLKIMESEGRRHPFYWASFIQSGEWGSLEVKR